MKKISVVLVVLAMMGMSSCCNKKCESTASDKVAVTEVKKSKKVVVARVIVREGKEDAFLEVATTLVAATRKEPGCLYYTCYRSATEPQAFIFYEEYKDDAAFQTHAGSAHFKVFADAIPDLLAGDLVVDEF